MLLRHDGADSYQTHVVTRAASHPGYYRPMTPPAGPSAVLREALNATRWVRLEASHEAMADLLCEEFPGAFWRSVLGRNLSDIDGVAFHALFDPADSARPEPAWCLTPPADFGGWVPRGGRLDCAITLFGSATVHLESCLRALEAFERTGIGPQGQRSPLRLVGAQLRTLSGVFAPISPAQAMTALEVFDTACLEAALPPGALQVDFVSPARFKKDSALLSELPPLELLVRRSMGRLVALAPAGLSEGVMARGEKHAWLDAVRPSQVLNQLSIDATTPGHYSGRQRRTYPLEGLKGSIAYSAPATIALPWLRLAEWVQIGGKTHFGFGVLSVHPLDVR